MAKSVDNKPIGCPVEQTTAQEASRTGGRVGPQRRTGGWGRAGTSHWWGNGQGNNVAVAGGRATTSRSRGAGQEGRSRELVMARTSQSWAGAGEGGASVTEWPS